MGKKSSDAVHRAWNVLRLAFLRARNGGKTRFMTELPLLRKYLKKLGNTSPLERIHYGERQFSFDKSPVFQVKMYRPTSIRFPILCIPCINPEVDIDYDFDVKCYKDCILEEKEYGCEDMVSYEEEGIDQRAEEFIAKFYKQMKLQRQISYLQYEEMPNKDSS